MFGYIVPEKPEMKVKEFELFRAYYCGVCKSIGRQHGQLKRFLLNYDSAFLAVLLTSLSGEKPEVKKEHCIAHHINKRYVVKNNTIVDYASDINILLAYYNLEDKKLDDGSVISGAGMILLKNAFRKIRKKHPGKCDIIESRLSELHKLESEGCSSMDMAAEPFAKLMEEVTAYGPLCKDAGNEKILRWIGYNLGKWIYILDAFDDLGKDIESGSYNPLLRQFGYQQGEALEAFKDRIRERVEFNLTYSLNQISKGYELMKIKGNSGILENIIYMGMLRKTENIIGTGSCNRIEQSI
ncbi:MAG: hypothetical protein HGA22_06030 [Clostridiales bacterium]|nr:hypothetical protein [Clostridiales bacterium]